ncbi:MAG: universal stress protein [Rhodospirillales bacterium]|jgi:nucleotide-binding universal stress UspA family protein|nr:universal stress protein [Rhodospirillales bacterium]
MKRFKNILVLLGGVSDKDPALLRAMALAASNQARLTLALCLEEFGDEPPADELRRSVVDGLRARLLAVADDLRHRGFRADAEIVFGRTFIQAIVRILRRQHDLVVKTARSQPLAGAALFGSTDLHLLRKCPCPVWMIHPRSGAHRGGVLAAVDASSDDADRRALNTMIMQLATSLSLLEETPLHVLHAWHLPAKNTLLDSPWLKIPRAEVDRLAEETRRSRKSRFDDLLAPFQPIAPGMQVHFREGNPEAVIPAVAFETDAEVIVMATIGRTGIPGLIIGNTAEEVLGQVDCSVLAIKPASFVTPVAA